VLRGEDGRVQYGGRWEGPAGKAVQLAPTLVIDDAMTPACVDPRVNGQPVDSLVRGVSLQPVNQVRYR
jgi:hypothetical protein